jgi:hypothetical protein
MTQLAIRTDVYQPKIVDGLDTGYLEYVKQQSYKSVQEQFVAVLKSIHVESWGHCAHGGLEYISYQAYEQDIKADIPKGALRVLVREGNCEGNRLELLIESAENFQLIPIMAAKYLTDRDEVWNIAKIIDEACHNGQFGH